MDKKPSKSLHIVFQVINYIKLGNGQLLSDDEKLLLIILASHHGKRGIFPSIKTLSTERNRHRTAIIDTLNKLQQKNLIICHKNRGKVNYYELCIPLPTRSVDTTSSVDTTRSVDTQDQSCGHYYTSSVGTTRYNKLNNKRNNRERGVREKRASLYVSFLPNEKAKALCDSRGLDVAFLAQKFVAFSKAEGKEYEDEQAAFELFILKERIVSNLLATSRSMISQDEERKICNGCQRPEYYCSCKLASRETNIKCLDEIRNKLLRK